jgi:hypothetical protein
MSGWSTPPPEKFSQQWLDAWNAHDIEAVLAHFERPPQRAVATCSAPLRTSGGQHHCPGRRSLLLRPRAGLVLASLIVLVGVPLVHLLPSWGSAGLWVLVLGLVIVVVATTLEKSRAALHKDLIRFGDVRLGVSCYPMTSALAVSESMWTRNRRSSISVYSLPNSGPRCAPT